MVCKDHLTIRLSSLPLLEYKYQVAAWLDLSESVAEEAGVPNLWETDQAGLNVSMQITTLLDRIAIENFMESDNDILSKPKTFKDLARLLTDLVQPKTVAEQIAVFKEFTNAKPAPGERCDVFAKRVCRLAGLAAIPTSSEALIRIVLPVVLRQLSIRLDKSLPAHLATTSELSEWVWEEFSTSQAENNAPKASRLRASPPTLVFLRHGETDWNAEDRMQGTSNIPLNERGIEQSRKASKALQECGFVFDRIISSDLARAQMTGNIIAEAQSLAQNATPLTIEDSTGCRERHMGVLEGMTYTDARRLAADEGKRSLFEYGESRRDLLKRLSKELSRIITTSMTSGHRNVLIVSHGSTLFHLCQHLAISGVGNTFVKDRWDQRMGHCAITAIKHGQFVMYAENLSDSDTISNPGALSESNNTNIDKSDDGTTIIEHDKA